MAGYIWRSMGLSCSSVSVAWEVLPPPAHITEAFTHGIRAGDGNFASNPSNLDKYSSCSQVLYIFLGLQQHCNERTQNYNAERWQNFITVIYHWPVVTGCFASGSLREPGVDHSLLSAISLRDFSTHLVGLQIYLHGSSRKTESGAPGEFAFSFESNATGSVIFLLHHVVAANWIPGRPLDGRAPGETAEPA